ncbi:ABC transporter permease [Weissella confusa]|uniref:ABC transporter permease n=1 Tax=Weissella confusa TaxID=1583 RepID=UPI0035A2F47A
MLIKLELQKFFKKTSTWVMPLTIFGLGLLLALANALDHSETVKLLVNQEFTGTLALVTDLMLLGVAGRVITSEFTFGTMKMLFAQRFTRQQIFMAKLVTVAVAFVLLQAALFITMVMISLLFGHAWLVDLSSFAGYLFGSVISSILFVSVMFVVANLIRNDLLVVVIGILMILLLQVIGAVVVGHGILPLDYSPLGAFYVSAMAGLPGVMAEYQMNGFLVGLVTIIYSGVLYGVALMLFKHREV